VRRGKSLVVVMLGVLALAGCAEEEKPIDVPENVQQGVLAVLKAVDPDVKATFTGETCNTDRLADPPDDHRWRLTATFDGTPDDVRAAGTKLGWQPERTEDGTLVLVNYHEFGERVDVVVRDGSAKMVVEQDCSTLASSELGLSGFPDPDPTDAQGDRLADMLDEIDETLADIDRELRVRPKDGVYAGEEGPRTYRGCSAGERSGAKWQEDGVLNAEATSDDDLGPTADRLVDVVDGGWDVVKREEGVDGRNRRELDLELRSKDSRTTMLVDLSFWGEKDETGGIRLFVTRVATPCVAVDAE
jgi:hypothetical protein